MKIICKKHQCTGCEACSNICPQKCIAMRSDGEGFLYPDIDNERCVDCKQCSNVCPVNKLPGNNDSSSLVFVGTLIDENERIKSSSGGVFYALAESVLDQKGVVYGASFTKELEVVHMGVTEKEQLYKLRGSKYVQSRIATVYSEIREHLLKKRLVLFSGTPCQIAGLKSFLRKEYDNLITCDIICHGVPSPGLFALSLKYIKSKVKKEIIKYSFRSSEIWGDFSSNIITADLKKKSLAGFSNFYMMSFMKNLCFREACYHCIYANENRIGDITLGDYWGISGLRLLNCDISKGMSLVIANTIKGRMILQENKYIILEKRSYLEASKKNANMKYSTIRPSLRDSYYVDVNRMSIQCFCKKYDIAPKYTFKELLGSYVNRIKGIQI